MSQMLAREYYTNNNVLWYPIELNIIPEEPAKDCYGEPKMAKELKPVATKTERVFNEKTKQWKWYSKDNTDHHLYTRQKTAKSPPFNTYMSSTPEQHDFDFSTEIIIKRQNLLQVPFWKKRFNFIAVDTRKLNHIDLDCPEYIQDYKDLLKIFPYTVSATKSFGKHINVICSTDIPFPANRFKLFNGDFLPNGRSDVEMLAGQWAYVPIDAIMYNADCKDMFWDFTKYILNVSMTIKEVKTDNSKNTIENTQTKKEDNNKPKHNKEVLKRLIEMLNYDKYTALDYRTEFFRICDAMKANGFAQEDWLAFVKRSKNMSGDIEQQNLFQKCRGTTEIGYIKKIAKKNNPTEYHLWLMENSRIMGLNILNKGEKDVAQFISKTLKRNLILCNEEWWTHDEDTGLWRKIKDPTYTVINCIQEYINETTFLVEYKITQTKETEKLKDLDEQRGDLHKHYRNVSKSSYSSQVIKALKELLVNNEFVNNLDVLKGQLAFKNGVMDLKTKKFREGIQYDDFITKSIPFDYKESDHAYLKTVLKKIMNNNDEHLEYFLGLIGYSFIGEAHLEKNMYFMIDKTEGGRGDNGKTFFFDILQDILPNYVYRSNSKMLSLNNTKSHKQITQLKGKRLVFLEELPNDDINCELLKELADGKSYDNEVMFGTTEIIKITCKLFALSNHIPVIKAKDSAPFNRYNQCSFNSHFDRTGERKVEVPEKLLFIADKELSQKIKDNHRDEVISLIIHYAHKYYVEKLPKIPAQFSKDIEETKLANDEFGTWAKKFLKYSTNAKISKVELVEKSSIEFSEIKRGMLKLGIKYNKDLKGNWKNENGVVLKGGFVGMKLKTYEELTLEYPEEDFEEMKEGINIECCIQSDE